MEDGTGTAKKEKFVPVKLDNNTIIRIEVTPLHEPGSEEESEEEYVSTKSLPSFEDITNIIKGVSKAIVTVWQEVQPSKATVEFGIEIGFEPGKVIALLVQGSGKTNFNITLEWGNQESSNTIVKP